MIPFIICLVKEIHSFYEAVKQSSGVPYHFVASHALEIVGELILARLTVTERAYEGIAVFVLQATLINGKITAVISIARYLFFSHN